MTDKDDLQLPDLKEANLSDLTKMKDTLEGFIEKRLAARKQEALAQIKRLSIEYELTYDEVVQAIRTTTKRGKAPALYRNPDNPRQTWSGKGQPPAWYATHPNPKSLRIPGT